MEKNDQLFESIFKKGSLDNATETLQQIAEQHPYFSIAQFYLLHLMPEGSEGRKLQARKTGILFNNNYWLNFQLEAQKHPIAANTGQYTNDYTSPANGVNLPGDISSPTAIVNEDDVPGEVTPVATQPVTQETFSQPAEEVEIYQAETTHEEELNTSTPADEHFIAEDLKEKIAERGETIETAKALPLNDEKIHHLTEAEEIPETVMENQENGAAETASPSINEIEPAADEVEEIPETVVENQETGVAAIASPSINEIEPAADEVEAPREPALNNEMAAAATPDAEVAEPATEILPEPHNAFTGAPEITVAANEKTGSSAINSTAKKAVANDPGGEPAFPPMNFNFTTPLSGSGEPLLFEPLHTTDYFASVGIKLSEESLATDKLGKQLKSFTEWLKTMKKVHAGQAAGAESIAAGADKNIQHLAEQSNLDEAVITESMAEVLIQQGRTKKAVEVLEKLSLLNPAKSAYFAAKINQLKEL